MRPKQIAQVIQRAAKAQIEGDEDIQPIFIEGPPGVGKSAVVKQVADELKIGFIDVRLAQMDPTDLRGCLYVAKNASGQEEARYATSSVFPKDPAAKLILFLDELASAPPLTQASAYQLTLDRKIGEYSLPDGCYMVAAGNTLADRAVVYRMSTALASRFSWITYELSLDHWIGLGV